MRDSFREVSIQKSSKMLVLVSDHVILLSEITEDLSRDSMDNASSISKVRITLALANLPTSYNYRESLIKKNLSSVICWILARSPLRGVSTWWMMVELKRNVSQWVHQSSAQTLHCWLVLMT